MTPAARRDGSTDEWPLNKALPAGQTEEFSCMGPSLYMSYITVRIVSPLASEVFMVTGHAY